MDGLHGFPPGGENACLYQHDFLKVRNRSPGSEFFEKLQSFSGAAPGGVQNIVGHVHPVTCFLVHDFMGPFSQFPEKLQTSGAVPDGGHLSEGGETPGKTFPVQTRSGVMVGGFQSPGLAFRRGTAFSQKLRRNPVNSPGVIRSKKALRRLSQKTSGEMAHVAVTGEKACSHEPFQHRFRIGAGKGAVNMCEQVAPEASSQKPRHPKAASQLSGKAVHSALKNRFHCWGNADGARNQLPSITGPLLQISAGNHVKQGLVHKNRVSHRGFGKEGNQGFHQVRFFVTLQRAFDEISDLHGGHRGWMQNSEPVCRYLFGEIFTDQNEEQGNAFGGQHKQPGENPDRRFIGAVNIPDKHDNPFSRSGNFPQGARKPWGKMLPPRLGPVSPDDEPHCQWRPSRPAEAAALDNMLFPF